MIMWGPVLLGGRRVGEEVWPVVGGVVSGVRIQFSLKNISASGGLRPQTSHY